MIIGRVKWLLLFSVVTMMVLQSIGQNVEKNHLAFSGTERDSTNAQDRSFLDWVGLGTGPNVDPYLASTNAACLEGDLAECFKSRALVSLDEFFDKSTYQLSEHARIRRMPETQLRQLAHEPYEFSESPRGDEPEWDQLVKFVMRKVERFLKSTGMELDFSEDVTDRGRYSPRFIDEIVDEIDVIEDKKDSFIKRKQLKKLFIPMLIVLKLFKLKLLLFLPLILGLASFKKFLGFLAIVIPGLIAYFKFCKPDFQSTFGPVNNHHVPHYSQSGIAYPPHQYSTDYHDSYYYGGGGYGRDVNFKDDNAQSLAYNGWNQYRSNSRSVKALPETSSKKSILPDS